MDNTTLDSTDQELTHSELYRNLLHTLELGTWLSVKQLRSIETNMEVKRLQPGDELFQIGSDDGRTYFLVSGHLELIAADGQKHMLSGSSSSSYAPVANLRSRRYTVKAMTKAKLICISDVDLVASLKRRNVDTDSGFDVEYIDDDSDFWDLLPDKQRKESGSEKRERAEDSPTSYLNFTY